MYPYGDALLDGAACRPFLLGPVWISLILRIQILESHRLSNRQILGWIMKSDFTGLSKSWNPPSSSIFPILIKIYSKSRF
jgi:hypothetical protein